jgi:hypothetical protein
LYGGGGTLYTLAVHFTHVLVHVCPLFSRRARGDDGGGRGLTRASAAAAVYRSGTLSSSFSRPSSRHRTRGRRAAAAEEGRRAAAAVADQPRAATRLFALAAPHEAVFTVFIIARAGLWWAKRVSNFFLQLEERRDPRPPRVASWVRGGASVSSTFSRVVTASSQRHGVGCQGEGQGAEGVVVLSTSTVKLRHHPPS